MILKTGKDFSDSLFEDIDDEHPDQTNSNQDAPTTPVDNTEFNLKVWNKDTVKNALFSSDYSEISFSNIARLINATAKGEFQNYPEVAIRLLEAWKALEAILLTKHNRKNAKDNNKHWTERLAVFIESHVVELAIQKKLNEVTGKGFKFIDPNYKFLYKGNGLDEPDLKAENYTFEIKPRYSSTNLHNADFVIKYTTTSSQINFQVVSNTFKDSYDANNSWLKDILNKELKADLERGTSEKVTAARMRDLFKKLSECGTVADKLYTKYINTYTQAKNKKVNVDKNELAFLSGTNNLSTDATTKEIEKKIKELDAFINAEDKIQKTLRTKETVKENYKMIKTDFIKLYESLSTLNEDTKTDASKNFWKLAKENILSVEDFHTAYDEELTDFGRVYLFDRYTNLLNDKSTYGKIKKLVAENPDNWAIKALLKFWVLQFSTKAKTKAEVDKEKARAEVNEAHVQKYKEWTPSVLAELDQDLVKKYLDVWKIKVEDITYSTYDYYEHGQFHMRKLTVLPSGWDSEWSVRDNDEPKRENLVAFWTPSMLKWEIEKAERAERTRQYAENQKSNNVIDVFKNTDCKWYHAIVEGESGKLYYVHFGSSSYAVKSLSKKVGKEVIDAQFLCNVPESYKVIYTECEDKSSISMMRTYYSSHYSWDSSNAAACKLAPKIESTSEPYSDSSTKKVSSGDGKNYSLMNNIDSWAYRSTVNYNYD